MIDQAGDFGLRGIRPKVQKGMRTVNNETRQCVRPGLGFWSSGNPAQSAEGDADREKRDTPVRATGLEFWPSGNPAQSALDICFTGDNSRRYVSDRPPPLDAGKHRGGRENFSRAEDDDADLDIDSE